MAKYDSIDKSIVRADKKLRTLALFALAVLAAAGVLLIREFHSSLTQIRELSRTEPALAIREMQSLLNALLAVNAFVSAVLAAYLLRLGIKTLRTGSYPPAGMRVIRDTRVQVGGKARLIAAAHLCLALLILSTNAMLWQFRTLFEKLLQG